MSRFVFIVLDGVGVGRPARRRRLRRRRLGHAGQSQPRGRPPPAVPAEARAWATSSPSWACLRCAAPLALTGRLATLSAGKDTTVGHWEHMGLVTARPFPTYPGRLPRGSPGPVQGADRPGSAGQQAGFGHGHHRGTGRGAPGQRQRRSSTPRPTASSRSPPTSTWSRWSSSTSGARSPASILQGPHAVARVIARPFTGSAGRVRPHQGPARLLAGASRPHVPRPAARRRRAGAGAGQDQRGLRGPGSDHQDQGGLQRREPGPGARSAASAAPSGAASTRACSSPTWWTSTWCGAIATTWTASPRGLAAVDAALPGIIAALGPGRHACSSPPTTGSTPPLPAPTTAGSTSRCCSTRGRRTARRPCTRALWPTPGRLSTRRSPARTRRSGGDVLHGLPPEPGLAGLHAGSALSARRRAGSAARPRGRRRRPRRPPRSCGRASGRPPAAAVVLGSGLAAALQACARVAEVPVPRHPVLGGGAGARASLPAVAGGLGSDGRSRCSRAGSTATRAST